MSSFHGETRVGAVPVLVNPGRATPTATSARTKCHFGSSSSMAALMHETAQCPQVLAKAHANSTRDLVRAKSITSFSWSCFFCLASHCFCSRSPKLQIVSLLIFCQVALRTGHFELCNRPSNPLPTASTLCGTIPGPAECAKRLNPATEPSGRR